MATLAPSEAGKGGHADPILKYRDDVSHAIGLAIGYLRALGDDRLRRDASGAVSARPYFEAADTLERNRRWMVEGAVAGALAPIEITTTGKGGWAHTATAESALAMDARIAAEKEVPA
jgi:hypothetical protein